MDAASVTFYACPRMTERLRIAYPPVPNPRAPDFKLPSGTCDSHFHVMGPPDRFPFADTKAYVPATAPFEHYVNLAELLGIDRGVVTQPMGHGFDNGVTLDAVARSDGRFRAVLKADDRFSAADYRSFHEQGARGVRLTLFAGAGGGMELAMFDRTIAAIAPHGWSVTLHAMPEQLIEAAEWIARIPIPVVIDHFGRIDVTQGLDQPGFEVYLDLVRLPHVWAKLCCAERLTRTGHPYDDVMPFVHATVAAAPERLIWGTDWPHTQRWKPGEMCDDGDLVDLVPAMVPDAGTRHRMLVENPAGLFDF